MQLTSRIGRRGLRGSVAVSLVAAIACVASVSASARPTSSHSQKLINVTETGFKVISLAPVYIAIDHGDFKRNGLNFTLQELQSGALGAPTILSGNAEFTDLGVNDVVNLYNQHKSVQLFYNLEKSLTMDMIMSKKVAHEKRITLKSPIKKKFRALKGLKIGITTPGAPTDVYPRYFMQQVGLNPQKDATFVPIGNATDLVGALQAGRIDAFMLSPPGPYLAQKEGFGTVVIKGAQSLPVFKTYDFTSVAVIKSYAASHPQIVLDYCKAVDAATKWMIAHPAQATAMLHKNQFSDTDMPTLTLSVKLFLETANPTGMMTKAGVANQVKVLKQMHALTGTAPTADGVVWTDKFTKNALH